MVQASAVLAAAVLEQFEPGLALPVGVDLGLQRVGATLERLGAFVGRREFLLASRGRLVCAASASSAAVVSWSRTGSVRIGTDNSGTTVPAIPMSKTPAPYSAMMPALPVAVGHPFGKTLTNHTTATTLARKPR